MIAGGIAWRGLGGSHEKKLCEVPFNRVNVTGMEAQPLSEG